MATASSRAEHLVEGIVNSIDIPRSYYEKAVDRYSSIGNWLCREESALARFEPAVAAQGSFRLGTVVRPVIPSEAYDLDTVCKLLKLSKAHVTQQQLKSLVGHELALYAKAKGIEEPLIERKRCWRLEYADEIRFHIDCLPCIPEDNQIISQLIQLGVSPALASQAIALTCTTHPRYAIICSDWPTSSPGGYAQWFERRFSAKAEIRRRQLLAEGVFKSLEQIPLYALKTPLQRSIQWLKRHRDVMFSRKPELKPISMIITTLAAYAYAGQEDLFECLQGILQRMPDCVRASHPKIPNPVNPGEDFADKWASDRSLEENFWLWHQKASSDLASLVSAKDSQHLRKIVESQFEVSLPEDTIRKSLPTNSQLVAAVPAIVVVQTPPKPWSSGNA